MSVHFLHQRDATDHHVEHLLRRAQVDDAMLRGAAIVRWVCIVATWAAVIGLYLWMAWE
jgi:hypothetical protein